MTGYSRGVSTFAAAVERAERAQLIADLKAARSELVTRGRTGGEFVDQETGAVCALGAVGFATVDDFDIRHECGYGALAVTPRALRVWHTLRGFLPEGFIDVDAFNDTGTTTDEDVLNLFDKALADLGGMA